MTSAFVTGLYGIFRNTPHLGILVGSAAINSGITGATFFSKPNQRRRKKPNYWALLLDIREFGVSPILTHVAPWKQYVHRRRELGINNLRDDPYSSENISWSDLRTDRLLDSGVAGAVTGGVLRGLKSMLYLNRFYVSTKYTSSTNRSACYCIWCYHS